MRARLPFRRTPGGQKEGLASGREQLTVGVTGISGTIGHGLLPHLEADPGVRKVVGIGSRPRFPGGAPFGKLVYRQADVRDRYTVRRALAGADVVVHLAFSLPGVRQSERTLQQMNVKGSRNVLAAAAAVGARRFIYTSSAAVYGFNPRRPAIVDESAPLDPEPRHFYARHKARVEGALLHDLAELPGMSWVFFRPCAVVGPHAVGAAGHAVPAPLVRAAGALLTIGGAAGLRPVIPGPPVPLQFVHERDAGQAVHRAIGSEVSGTILNLSGEGMVEPSEVPRLLGLHTLPVPNAVTRTALALTASMPYVTPALGWLQLLTRPLELDSARARRELGWRPEFTSREALASTRRALAL